MYRLGLGPKLRPSTKVVDTTTALGTVRVGTLDGREVEEAKVT